MAAVKTQEISAKKQPENWPSSLLILQSRPPAGVSWELQSPKGGGVKGQVYKTFLSEACSDSGLKIATAAQARGLSPWLLGATKEVLKQTFKALGGVVLMLSPAAAAVASLSSLHGAAGTGDCHRSLSPSRAAEGHEQQGSTALGTRKAVTSNSSSCNLETFLGLFFL